MHRALALALIVLLVVPHSALASEPTTVTSPTTNSGGPKLLAISGGVVFGLSYLASLIGGLAVGTDVGRRDSTLGILLGGTMAVPVLGPAFVASMVQAPSVNDLRALYFIDAGVQLVGLSMLVIGLVLHHQGASPVVQLTPTASLHFGEGGLVRLRF